MKKIKNSQPQTKFTGSYKKKSVIVFLFLLFYSLNTKEHFQEKKKTVRKCWIKYW